MADILKLLPCPFCGRQPTLDAANGFIVCQSEECFGPQTTAVGDSAIDQWNHRAEDQEKQEMKIKLEATKDLAIKAINLIKF